MLLLLLMSCLANWGPDIEESGVRSDPGEAYFDSSTVEPEKTGDERISVCG